MVNRNLLRSLDNDLESEYTDLGSLFDEDLETVFTEMVTEEQDYDINKIVDGRVLRIEDDLVLIDVGFKSEAHIPLHEWEEDDQPVIGKSYKVLIEDLEDELGNTTDPHAMISLSKAKAEKIIEWERMMASVQEGQVVTGVVKRKIKGGLLVDIGVSVFLPASQVDIRRPHDIGDYLERTVQCEVLKIDESRRNIVVSRRSLIERQRQEDREQLMRELEVGQIRKGVVKNIADFGAFIDLGGIDGLLHITDMAWKRVRHPSEVVEVGDELEVRVLRFDRERMRVSLGLKQLGDDPWQDIARRYPNGSRLFGKVTNITDYGCFVEIEDGVEGLVHVSEMDWTNKNVNPNKVVHIGQEVEVMVLDVDEERRRISLGMKQCTANPWEAFAATHNKGDKVSGAIKSITDFGIFIGLEGGIDGLVHLSDISWMDPGEESLRNFRKGEEVEAVVLAVDPERERISLGIKQLEQDPFATFMAEHPRGSMVKGTVREVDAKGATVDLADGVDGYIKASDLAKEKVEDATKVLSEGDEIEAKFVSLDRKNRTLTLSIRAKEDDELADAIEEYQSQSAAGSTKLGELLKEQLGNKD